MVCSGFGFRGHHYLSLVLVVIISIPFFSLHFSFRHASMVSIKSVQGMLNIISFPLAFCIISSFRGGWGARISF